MFDWRACTFRETRESRNDGLHKFNKHLRRSCYFPHVRGGEKGKVIAILKDPQLTRDVEKRAVVTANPSTVINIILYVDVVELRLSFCGTRYIARCSFNSTAVFLLIPLSLWLASLSESFSFLLTNNADPVRPRIASCQPALIHGHLSYLHELAVSSYSPVGRKRTRQKSRKTRFDSTRPIK